MPAALSGTLYILDDQFMYVGPLLSSAPHAHHAGQIMWVPGGVALRTGQSAQRTVTFAVIRPDQAHAHGEATLAAMLWLDGDDVRWRAAAAQEHALAAARAELGALHGDLSVHAAHALARRMLQVLTAAAEPGCSRERQHPAVARMCALLDAGSSTPARELSVGQLARRSGLSERQLREVFLRDTGLSPRAYLRWRRLRRAVSGIREGASLTQAAVLAGFADGAHFSRVFRSQFGMSPTSAFASLRFVVPPPRARISVPGTS